jgi:hypothetical protein
MIMNTMKISPSETLSAKDQQDDDRPSPRDRDRPAQVPRLRVCREAARENGDDRERDREVREARPSAGELLLVSQLRESLLVSAQSLVGHAIVPPWWESGVARLYVSQGTERNPCH